MTANVRKTAGQKAIRELKRLRTSARNQARTRAGCADCSWLCWRCSTCYEASSSKGPQASRTLRLP
jgi:hypothetical protein